MFNSDGAVSLIRATVSDLTSLECFCKRDMFEILITSDTMLKVSGEMVLHVGVHQNLSLMILGLMYELIVHLLS